MPETKPCLAGCGQLISSQGMGPKHFAEKRYCCMACSVAHRKVRRGGDHRPPSEPARSRSKRAMNTHWQVQHAIAAAKAAGAPIRGPRQDEEDAIARFIAERGVSVCPPAGQEEIQARRELPKPLPMAGWR